MKEFDALVKVVSILRKKCPWDKKQTHKTLKPYMLEETNEAIEAIEKTEVFKRRFRHCATRGLMILRNYAGRHKSVGKQQVGSHFLLAAAQKASKDFPILREAKREIMEDVMDIENTKIVLDWMKDGKIKTGYRIAFMASPKMIGKTYAEIEQNILFVLRKARVI